MDFKTSRCFQAPTFLASDDDHGETPLEAKACFNKKIDNNPFADTYPDPLCKINLKETSEFVKSFPMLNHSAEARGFLDTSVSKRNQEAPSTPGRPIFSFSSRKNFPSKWDDAQKWLNGSSSSFCDSPPVNFHGLKPSETIKPYKSVFKQQEEVFADESRVTDEKVSQDKSNSQGSLSSENYGITRAFNGFPPSAEVLLKDKFTKEAPIVRCSEPIREGFVFRNMEDKSMKDAATEVVLEVKHRHIGTEMTPLGSSTTSRCPTPFQSTSPVRHNTPENRSGPLALTHCDSVASTIDIAQLEECHLAKLHNGLVVSTWSSREDEEEEISKSLRHFEIGGECRKSVSEPRDCAWEEEEKNKCCLRYQREEARIQAWLNLQAAKAEAQSRKLEVKIEKMRSALEEKLMKRMSVVHRKAEEWRSTAQLQHGENIRRATKQVASNKKSSNFSCHKNTSCGCFPCNNNQFY